MIRGKYSFGMQAGKMVAAFPVGSVQATRPTNRKTTPDYLMAAQAFWYVVTGKGPCAPR